jgi:hypothetical protein
VKRNIKVTTFIKLFLEVTKLSKTKQNNYGQDVLSSLQLDYTANTH